MVGHGGQRWTGEGVEEVKTVPEVVRLEVGQVVCWDKCKGKVILGVSDGLGMGFSRVILVLGMIIG